MSRDIKDIIFNENSTLFQVLDQLDITDIVDIKAQTNSLQREVSANKIQLDSLAIKQDNFEGTTNAHFVAINTQFQNQSEQLADIESNIVVVKDDIGILSERVKDHQNQIDDFYASFELLDQQLSNIQQSIIDLGDSFEDLEKRQNEVDIKVNTMSTKVESLKVSIDATNKRVSEINSKVSIMQSDIVTIQKQIVTGVRVLQGTKLYVWQYQFGRMSEFTYAGIDAWMLLGKTYSVKMTGWLNGDYKIEVGPNDPDVNNKYIIPSSHSVPVVSGNTYRFYYGSGNLNFTAMIYT
uniref:Putative ORF3 protein n=1 Tax=Ceratitis capitata TaxID=7213 RepID=W8APM3_CERCA